MCPNYDGKEKTLRVSFNLEENLSPNGRQSLTNTFCFSVSGYLLRSAPWTPLLGAPEVPVL